MTPRDCLLTGFLILFLLISGCASRKTGDGPPRTGSSIPRPLPADPIPRDEPLSRYGNGPTYEVWGTQYKVMRSNYGYRERGVASWYGKKFHGRSTSSQEPYDMYAMTAAHKTLPIPSFARVRNLTNNKSIVVRVNDRGPFVDNRIIDLSYSAARKLDMLAAGTSLVEVTAISFDKPPANKRANADKVRATPSRTDAETITATTVASNESNPIYVQVGAFGEKSNARRRLGLLKDNGIGQTFVHQESGRSPPLYRVRIGPIASVDQYDVIVAKLERMGINESHLITE